MRIINVMLLVFLIIFGFYQWKFDDSELSGTRWSCHELSKKFTSEPYKKYQEIGERNVLTFASSSNLTIFQSGELVLKTGKREKYEVLFDMTYTVHKNRISLAYKSIDWYQKPEGSPIFVRDADSLKGFKADLKFLIDDERLYFYNRINNEDSNFVCFSV